jgi:hypothetical protein
MNKLKKWQKLLLYIMAIILLILFISPRIARIYIEQNSQELIGRKVEIKHIRLNYLTGALRIKQLQFYEKDTNAVFIGFDKFKINLQYWPLLKKEVRISEISFDNLHTHVIQKADWFNFSDLIQQTDSTNSNRERDTLKGSGNLPYTISVNNIKFNNSHIQYTDQILNHTILLEDMDLFIPGFTWSTGSTNLSLDFDFIGGGNFFTALEFNQSDSTYSLNLQLDSLNVDVIEPYIKNSLAISEINGYFSNNIHISGDLQHLTHISMSGWNKIEGLVVHDMVERPVLSLSELMIRVDTLILEDYQILVNEITLKEPFLLFELIDSTNNWSAMMIKNDSADAATADTIDTSDKNDAEFIFSLDKLKVQNGLITFSDQRLRESFESNLSDININSKDIGAQAKEVKIDLNALLNNRAIIGSNFIFQPQQLETMDIAFELKNFYLNDIEPYMVHYFGYPVEAGMLNFSTNNSITENTINSNSSLYIRQFKLGEPNKKEAEIKLPLRLALGVLSDKNGIIDFDIPFEKSGEEAGISNLGRLIAKTIGNLFLKAATSPAELLSSLYGTNPNKLKGIQIGLFDEMPVDAELETLDLLAEILDDKPGIDVQFYHYLNKNTFFDSLSYIQAVDAWHKKHETAKVLQKQQISDSTLKVFLLKKLSPEQIENNTSLTELCLLFADSSELMAAYDSTRTLQIKNVSDYLIHHKQVPESRFRFSTNIADSLFHEKPYGNFFIEFISSASNP